MKIRHIFLSKISIFYFVLILNLIDINFILCDKNQKNSNKNSKDLEIEEDFIGKLYYRLGKNLII
jgi:hypothetical protein